MLMTKVACRAAIDAMGFRIVSIVLMNWVVLLNLQVQHYVSVNFILHSAFIKFSRCDAFSLVRVDFPLFPLSHVTEKLLVPRSTCNRVFDVVLPCPREGVVAVNCETFVASTCVLSVWHLRRKFICVLQFRTENLIL